MRGVWSVADIRAAEATTMAELPDGLLMQRAAAGLASCCARLLAERRRVYGSQVAVLAGAGNNGGDALHAGARLAQRGAVVRAILLDRQRAHSGGLAALLAAGGRVSDSIGDPDLVLDGIVGIGGRGGLRPAAAALAEQAAATSAILVSVDAPSGVDCDTGAVVGEAFDADVTATFGGLKPGLVIGAGADHAGQVELIDIGLDLPPAGCQVLDDADVAQLLPRPGAGDDKYSRGVVGVVSGSAAYGGAAVLSVAGALHAGAGMVRYAGSAAAGVRARWPEAVVSEGAPHEAGRVQAWVVGPGLGTDDAARAQLADVLATDVPVLVDADGITLLARHRDLLRDRNAPTVITPHDREFARIAGDVGGDRLSSARRAAAELGLTVLLKGNATIVADPDGRVYVNPTGTPWLATAGSGDVLAGCVGALLAAGLPPLEAAAIGAYLHGLAGQIAADDAPTTASAVAEALPAAGRQLGGRGHRPLWLNGGRRTRVVAEGAAWSPTT